MILYRIEHKKNGQGPFRNKLTQGADYHPPGPNSDGIFGSYTDYYEAVKKGIAQKYHYAFKSIFHMKDWFCEDSVRKFLRRDHVIVKFEIPESKVLFGTYQC